MEHAEAAQGGPANPLLYPGWDSLLDTHPDTCFFHSSAWARVLHETYGHEPVYFCDIENNRLQGLLPLMEVRTPLLGTCGVSLPFTDVCPPIFSRRDMGWDPYEMAIRLGQTRGWKSLECRSRDHRWPGAVPSVAFYAHSIALDRTTENAFKAVKSTVRTAVKKAQASGLSIQFDQSAAAIPAFYRLQSLTRSRHGLPPQPRRFFESIGRHVLATGSGVIVSASLGRKPIAAAVFFYRGKQAFFKYGASDYRFQNLRPNNLVMWEAIKWLKERGITSLHLGRTSLANTGLRRFKLGFGADEERLDYFKYAFPARNFVSSADRAQTCFNSLFRLLPLPLLRFSGALLYPHIPG